MKVVMLYELADGGLTKAPLHIAAHGQLLREFKQQGTLLMAGPFANPAEGAMAVFTNRGAAEAFIKIDPFVTQGVVGKYRLIDWNEALA